MWAIGILGTMAAACQAEPESGDCAALPEPLAGGVAGGQWPAVGLLRLGRTLCTGTLIAPRVVISARHCATELVALRDEGITDLGDVSFLTGKSGEQLQAFATGLYWTEGEDLLAVVLDRPPGVEPLPYRAAPVARQAIGSEVTLVGYGNTGPDASDHGVKRSGTATIEVVEELWFVVEASRGEQAAPCFGDSGGPALLDGQLAGVLSGGDPACAGRGDLYLRIDRHLDLVDRAVAAADQTPDVDCR